MEKTKKKEFINRDLAWQNDDLLKRASIAYQFARYALKLTYESLPLEVIHQVKRILLDTFACAIGASKSPGRRIIEEMINELGGQPESTVWGSGLQTSTLNTTLMNGFLIRYLDYNDNGGGCHNSEAIAAILAVAERQRAKIEDFILSTVISYELGERVRESIIGKLEETGWNNDSRTGFSMPPALGKLMGLNEDQIANAIGIAGPHSPSLGILDADQEELAMSKNLRFSIGAYQSILACFLSKRGFSGYLRVIEGDKGFRQVLTNNRMDLKRLVDFSGWRIMNTTFKTLCMNYDTHSNILATLAIVKEHDLKPEDIALVRIKTNARDVRHVTTIPWKKYPRNTENATHSIFFGNAMAIKERALGPEQFRSEKFEDPVILDLIEKIIVERDPKIPESGELSLGGSSEIITTDNRRFEKSFDFPHGYIVDPLTDAEIEDKFKQAASIYMNSSNIKTIIESVWNLESLNAVQDLTKLLVWDNT